LDRSAFSLSHCPKNRSRRILQLFKKPPKDHPLYAAVGRVAAEWAELEHRLDEIIWRLSGTTSPLASCITGQMIGHFPRFNTIIALVSLNRGSPELIKLIKAQQGKVSDLAESRARRVHDAWYVDLDTGEPHQFQSMPRKELTFGHQPQATSDMEDLVRKIAQRIEAVGKLNEAILAELSPLPDK
jgi:hypothetical protein